MGHSQECLILRISFGDIYHFAGMNPHALKQTSHREGSVAAVFFGAYLQPTEEQGALLVQTSNSLLDHTGAGAQSLWELCAFLSPLRPSVTPHSCHPPLPATERRIVVVFAGFTSFKSLASSAPVAYPTAAV